MNRKVASVILNYNSFADTVKCFQNIRSQSSVNQIIIIDNNSSSDERILLDEWFNSLNGSKGILKINDLSSDIAILKCTNSYELEIILGLNPKNQGYAAGNNIGLKIADYLGADSALIINPDIEIINPRFIEELEEALFSDDSIAISASQITNQNGTVENPLLLHDSFMTDFFWFIRLPFLKVISFFRIKNKSLKKYDAINTHNKKIEFVDKVSGACFLAKLSFLKEINFLDEGTFLYLEETILSSQIKKMNRRILFLGNLNAIHNHDYIQKKITARNAIIGCESYLHYLKKHSHFNKIQKTLLSFSVKCQIQAYKIILKLQNL